MKAVLVLVASLTFAISPLLNPEFGGFDPDRYPIPQDNPPVQPAGWAFSIWGLIYLSLIGHAVFGLLQKRADPAWERGRLPVFISLAVGSIWLPVALASPIWATVLIWVMLIAALASLYQSRGAAPEWVAEAPVALYAGWLSAASFVSIGLILGGYGVVSETAAAVISLLLAIVFAAVNFWRLQSWAYSAAVAWGLSAIALANLGGRELIVGLAAAGAVVMIGAVAWIALKSPEPQAKSAAAPR